jgi:hypothetical protein
MASTALLNQVWDITLSTPDLNGNEVTLDSPIIWASQDDTVVQARNVSADGKSGQLKVVGVSHVDADGNNIAVVCQFSADGDPTAGVKPLNARTEDLFGAAPPDGSAQQIVLTMSPPHDDMVP